MQDMSNSNGGGPSVGDAGSPDEIEEEDEDEDEDEDEGEDEANTVPYRRC